MESEPENCPICLYPLLTDLFNFRVCGHDLHSECADEFLMDQYRRHIGEVKCPVCRGIVMSKYDCEDHFLEMERNEAKRDKVKKLLEECLSDAPNATFNDVIERREPDSSLVDEHYLYSLSLFLEDMQGQRAHPVTSIPLLRFQAFYRRQERMFHFLSQYDTVEDFDMEDISEDDHFYELGIGYGLYEWEELSPGHFRMLLSDGSSVTFREPPPPTATEQDIATQAL